MTQQLKFPTILGIMILLLGVGVGVFLVNTRKTLELTAAPEETPKDVRITNITEKSFTVSWITEKKTSGFVSFGKNTSLGLVANDTFSLSNTHYTKVQNLDPQTNYFFKIGSNSKFFDNDGEAYQTKTSAKLEQPKKSDVVFGSVTTKEGAPKEGVIVYLTFTGASPLSATTDKEGRWVATLSEARTTNLGSIATYNSQTNLEIFVRKDAVFGSAKIPVGSAKPVPAIALGKNYNFSDIQTVQSSVVPASALELPKGQAQNTPTPTPQSSKSEVGPTPTPTPTPTSTPTPTTKPLGGTVLSPTPLTSPKPQGKPVTPIAGDLTPTILTFIMGLTLLSAGVLLTKAIIS